jgi:hypothetical protein
VWNTRKQQGKQRIRYEVIALASHLLTRVLFFVFRNFDILAAVFTDVLKFMHDDDMEATAS